MKKIGIIRCMQTEDICPGTTDFSFAAQGKGAFEELGPCEVIGFVSCGGCPGKRAVARARMLVDRGAEAVALASCICKGNPISFPCPHHETMIAAIRKKLGDGVPVLDMKYGGQREGRADVKDEYRYYEELGLLFEGCCREMASGRAR